jgi:hypothetical protein
MLMTADCFDAFSRELRHNDEKNVRLGYCNVGLSSDTFRSRYIVVFTTEAAETCLQL